MKKKEYTIFEVTSDRNLKVGGEYKTYEVTPKPIIKNRLKSFVIEHNPRATKQDLEFALQNEMEMEYNIGGESIVFDNSFPDDSKETVVQKIIHNIGEAYYGNKSWGIRNRIEKLKERIGQDVPYNEMSEV